ncbi:MAG: hypothetical protein ACOC7U_01590, partial [Spirochaetota bacterium]
VIIIVSIAVLYFNLSLYTASFNKLWPALVFLAGMGLYVYYFSLKNKRLFVLLLAIFMVISAVPLFVLTFTSYNNINYLWPGFLFALGMGLLSVHFYGKKRKITFFLSSLIISVSLLAWIIYSVKSRFGLIIGVILLLIGAGFLTRGLIREPEFREELEEESPAPENQEKGPGKTQEGQS